jgi:hypothetical protein
MSMASAPPTITCPRCQRQFKGKPELFGKRIKCPGCEKPFVVPSPQEKINEEELMEILSVEEEYEPATGGDEEYEPTADAKPTKRIYFPEDEGGPKEYGLGEYDETARCPNCANPLESAESVVCLFCGYNTSERTWGKTKVTYATTGGDRFKWLLPGIASLLFAFFQVIGCLYYCLVLPDQLGDGWKWLSHESLKMWTVIINLFIMWPAGYFAYMRLVMNPEPPEKEK